MLRARNRRRKFIKNLLLEKRKENKPYNRDLNPNLKINFCNAVAHVSSKS